MDETEVEVEIACWATRHPEASTLRSKGGSEPWLNFVGKSCTGTLHLGLGGLTWCIQVPLGYHTAIDTTDGTRKRQWEPLEYHDTVILQSRSTPFHVSVLQSGRKHGSQDDVILDFSCGLEMEFSRKANLLPDEREKDISGALVRELQLVLERVQISTGTPDSDVEGAKALPGTRNDYYVALKRAETLTEILDAIYGLVKFNNKRSSSAVSSDSDDHDRDDIEGGGFCEAVVEEDDEHLFDIEAALKWTNIKDDVKFARGACARAARLSRDFPLPPDTVLEDDGRSPLKEKLRRLDISHASGLDVEADVIEEYPPPFADDSESSMSSEDASNSDYKDATDTTDSSSDSEKSDSSWEKLDMLDLDESSPLLKAKPPTGKVGQYQRRPNKPSLPGFPRKNKRKFQDTRLSTGGIDALGKGLETPPARQRAEELMSPGQSPLMGATPSRHLDVLWREELKWCEIDFNDQSFSVECDIKIADFLSNAVATALGFDLEHSLRVEIVPNKSHVDSLSWTGAVDVYVSQQSDWHNHVAEEICGLLCVVPNIIHTYFFDQVPIVTSRRFSSRVKGANGDLFIGALRTLVRRLKGLDKEGSCCVCGQGGRRSWFLYMENRKLWVCESSICQATYTSWTAVSSLDIQEREREEKSALDKKEEELKDEFPYCDEENLRYLLEIYGMNNIHAMNYGQMIKALSKIRLWNEMDSLGGT